MKKVSFFASRKKLITLWMIISLFIFIVFFVQSINGKYTSHVKDIWQWVFQFLTPALTLMIGILVAQLLGGTPDSEVDVFFYRLAMGVSIFFLLLLLLSPFIVPFLHIQQNKDLAVDQQKNIFVAFQTYDIFLLPLQGLTMLTLGLFFSKNK